MVLIFKYATFVIAIAIYIFSKYYTSELFSMTKKQKCVAVFDLCTIIGAWFIFWHFNAPS